MKTLKVIVVVIVMVLSLAAITGYYWYQDQYYIATEDARVDSEIIKVSPQVTAKIIDLPVEEGQLLQENDIIGRQSDVSLVSGSNLDLAIIKAPITGTVIKKFAHIGEIGTPTVPVVYMADLKALYITANIEEDDLIRVKEGQYAEYTIDSFPGVQFSGRVISIGEASTSTFSLIPQQNTGNSYVKVTQRIPIKISIDDYENAKLLPGMNAYVKLHIK
ncbi:MAG: HlyD family secretion protein [Chitinophagales bacterium]